MEDLIFHMFFVVPLTKWITSPDRLWNKHSPVCGIILAVICLFTVGILQSTRDSPNHFETLGTAPNASRRVVSSTYRRLSLAYHPDKNPSMEAKEKFAKIREAHEVLSSERRRDAYCRFGDFSKEGEVDDEQFYDVMLFAVFQHLVPFLFGFLYTYGEESRNSRKLFSTYLAFTFSIEVLLRYDKSAYDLLSFVPIIGNFLPFEKIKLFESWVPIVLNSLLLLGIDMTNSEDDIIEDVAKHILQSNMDCIQNMDEYMEACKEAIKAGAKRGCSVTVSNSDISGGSLAFTNVQQTVTCEGLMETRPWELEKYPTDVKNRDMWKEVMSRETIMWPRDLKSGGLISRADCSAKNWKQYSKRLDALLLESDDDNNFGLSLGSVIFFAILFIRAIRSD